jgi:hypothetical protein
VNVKPIMTGTWLGQGAILARGYLVVLLILLIPGVYWRAAAGSLDMPGIISLTGEHLRRRYGQARTRRGPEGSGAARGAVAIPEHAGALHLTPGQRHQAAKQTAHKQVDGREGHSGMIPARQAVQARSSNRAPQGFRGSPLSDAPRGTGKGSIALNNSAHRGSVKGRYLNSGQMARAHPRLG